MLKLRLKRIGRKHVPFYKIVVTENTSKRDGKFIDEIGYYNPVTKIFAIKRRRLAKWVSYGVKPTKIVLNLLKTLRRHEIEEQRIEIMEREEHKYL